MAMDIIAVHSQVKTFNAEGAEKSKRERRESQCGIDAWCVEWAVFACDVGVVAIAAT
jgi:hypothetical protein